MVESLDGAYFKSVTPFELGQVSISLGHESSEDYAASLDAGYDRRAHEF